MQNRFELDSSTSAEFQPKENVNLRISADISEIIEEIMFFVRKEQKGHKKKITKSELYERIFREMINDYQVKGKESRLWRLTVACFQD